MVFLKASGLTFAYQDSVGAAGPLLAPMDFSVEQGELISILGASGSGKTTLLRLCAGFEPLSGGSLKVRDSQIREYRKTNPVGIGFVFQDFALFEHLTVQGNIHYGCVSRAQKERAQEIAAELGIVDLYPRSVGSLSGGERQRVALARALAVEPELLLLDEPFASIDASLTHQLVGEFRQLFKRCQTTVLMVTHSMEEAAGFSDRIFFLHQGKILQRGPVAEFFQDSRPKEVVDFFGDGVWLQGEIQGRFIETAHGRFPLNREYTEGPGQILLRGLQTPVVESCSTESS